MGKIKAIFSIVKTISSNANLNNNLLLSRVFEFYREKRFYFQRILKRATGRDGTIYLFQITYYIPRTTNQTKQLIFMSQQNKKKVVKIVQTSKWIVISWFIFEFQLSWHHNDKEKHCWEHDQRKIGHFVFHKLIIFVMAVVNWSQNFFSFLNFQFRRLWETEIWKFQEFLLLPSYILSIQKLYNITRVGYTSLHVLVHYMGPSGSKWLHDG